MEENRNESAVTQQHTEQKKYEAVMEFLRDGYGPRTATVLMTCIERYLYATNGLSMCPGEWDADNLWYLCTLLKCVLKDEFGIDLDK